MNNEMIAKAWELAAEICSNFDCRLLNPPRSDEELDYLDLATAEMKQQAGRIRAEEALIEGVHGNLISPNVTEQARCKASPGSAGGEVCPDCRGRCGRYDPNVGNMGTFYLCQKCKGNGWIPNVSLDGNLMSPNETEA